MLKLRNTCIIIYIPNACSGCCFLAVFYLIQTHCISTAANTVNEMSRSSVLVLCCFFKLH
jgi:hypothetical protein